MERLRRCWEGLDKARLTLASDRLLNGEQMARLVTIMGDCEREAAPFSVIVTEVRAALLRLTRCEMKGEYLDFLETQYRSRGLSNPRKIATLVVIEEATNALKRALAATMEQMQRTGVRSGAA
jgi:hypothetical protein